VAGGGVQDDGKALLLGADGTDGSPPPFEGRTRRDEIVPHCADPSGNAANDGSLAGGGGEHDKKPPPVGAGVVDDDTMLLEGAFCAEDGKTVTAGSGSGTLLMGGSYDAADPPPPPGAVPSPPFLRFPRAAVPTPSARGRTWAVAAASTTRRLR